MTSTSETPFTPDTFPNTRPRPSHDCFLPPAHTPHNLQSTSISADYFSHSRKRQRPDSGYDEDTPQQQQTPWTATPSWVECSSDRVYGSAGAVNVNERYRLAGGFDTPGLLATSDYDQRDQDLRSMQRNAGDGLGVDAMDPRQDGGRADSRAVSGPLARERNGIARIRPSASSGSEQRGWTSYAFQLVGKAFAFGSGMIRGFYAGDGKGYEFSSQQPLSDSWEHSRPPLQRQRRDSTPIPGQWQEESFQGDFEQDNLHSPTIGQSRPPNKRRQTDKDAWILVGTPDVEISVSPKRKPSSTHRPSLPSLRPSASRANSRRSLAPVSRRQSNHVAAAGSPALLTPTSCAALQDDRHDRRASIAPTRSANTSRPNSSSGQAVSHAYISPDTARLLKKQAKQDKAADRAMSSMSQRLQDMIRQGQQALGTKISVESDYDSSQDNVDEGFVDDEY